MNISINNPIISTQIFLVIFFLAFVFSFRKKREADFLSLQTTQELKGLAILLIIFSHIGYNLASDNRFLFPLSIAAGVGVNMFLFLSGYGLTYASLAKSYSVKQFYMRRLPKLFLPFWLSLAVLLPLDFIINNRSYGLATIGQAIIGFFPRADVSLDLNSPLWYFSLIIFYYLLFPLVLIRRRPWLTGVILYIIGYSAYRADPVFLNQVMRLYQVHILAFPLGVIAGGAVFSTWFSKAKDAAHAYILRLDGMLIIKKAVFWGLSLSLLCLSGYYSLHSHVGEARYIEEMTSILVMLCLVSLFMIKKIEIRLLYLFGVYSYEIYLLHWPLLSRFDFFYRFMPAWLATSLYLIYFLLLGWVLSLITARIAKRFDV